MKISCSLDSEIPDDCQLIICDAGRNSYIVNVEIKQLVHGNWISKGHVQVNSEDLKKAISKCVRV